MWQRALRSSCALAVVAALGATNAHGAPAWAPRRDLGIAQERASGVQAALMNMLQSQASDSFASMFPGAVRQELFSFYEMRQFRPVWSGGPAEENRAEEVLAVLAQAEDQGLHSEDYLSPALERGNRPRQGQEVAQYDIALTDAVLRYARDVAIGRVRPNDVYKDVKLPADKFDPVDVLTRMLRSRSISASLADLPPPHPEYRRLAQAMARYRAIAAQGGWPSLPARGEIGLDGNDRRAKALIERLAFEDPELAAIPDPDREAIQEAVRRFQSRNDLEADGRVSTATLAALNVPVSRRIEVLAANMERWRWLPRTFENRYIAVNVPDQSVAFVRNSDVVLSSRVVVGRKTSPTPITRAAVIALIANPPWEIPGDIVVNQILPKLRRSPGYLAASHMVLMNGPSSDPQGRTINWRNVSANAFPYRVVQIPGPHNALGNLMLDTPNDFDVYLHDTPGKALFKSNDRAVSNGCIRVEAVLQLASLALGDGDDATTARITEAINAGNTRRIELDTPLPVYFLYWTAIAAPDGAVGFRGDLYGRDARLIAALAAPRATERELNVAESNAIEPPIGSTRVSDTLLPAAIAPSADTERGAEIPPLDERGAEIPPLQETPSATQSEDLEGSVRRANERTQFTYGGGRTEAERTIESTRLTGRTWPSETSRYGRTRGAETDGRFPLLRRLFEGKPQQRYPRR
jgi:murein L,D-transpeptidase YcbB/YkuD